VSAIICISSPAADETGIAASGDAICAAKSAADTQIAINNLNA
jgi:hypothetical protein